MLLFSILFLLIRGLQWPLLPLLFSAYNPLIPTGLQLRGLLSAFKLGTVKLKCRLKVVLLLHLSLLNPWIIPSFPPASPARVCHLGQFGCSSFAPDPPQIRTFICRHMFVLKLNGRVILPVFFCFQGDRMSLKNTQRFMRAANNSFLIGFIQRDHRPHQRHLCIAMSTHSFIALTARTLPSGNIQLSLVN